MKPVEIYWSPYFINSTEIDWSMLYDGELPILYDILRKNMSHEERPGKNVFYCPPFKNLTSNIAVLRNTLHSKFKIENDVFIPTSSSHVSCGISRKPSMKNKKIIEYGMGWIFFSEEDIEITLSSPYFDSSDYMKYASIVPGKFNISTWFRKVNMELFLKDDATEFEIKKNEHIAYVNFNTNRQLKFTRFEMSPKLYTYANACSTSSDWESWIPLAERYARFKQSQVSKLILAEIKKNVVL